MNANSHIALYKTILKELLIQKQKLTNCDLLEKISVMETDMHRIAGSFNYSCSHYCDTLEFRCSLLSNITIIKTFLDFYLHLENYPLLSKQVFVNIFGTGFFDSIVSVNHSSITLRYALSELLSFIIFVSYKLEISQTTYYEKLQSLLHECGEDLMFVLYTFYHLCVLSNEYECNHFNEFLCGVLFGDCLPKYFAISDDKAQLLILRIYKQILSSAHNNDAKKTIFKGMSSIVSMLEAANTPLVHKQYWNFLNSLLPFPKNSDGYVIPIEDLLKIVQSKPIGTFAIQSREKISEADAKNSKPILPVFIIVLLKCVIWISDDFDTYQAMILASLSHIKKYVTESSLTKSDEDYKTVSATNCIISLFMDEDDELIDFLLLELELYCICQKIMASRQLTESSVFNPHQLFIQVVHNLSYDSSILLDWLVSNETRFLCYFVKYLKFLGATWIGFVEICNTKHTVLGSSFAEHDITESLLNKCVSTLIRLKYSIVKLQKSKLFPYCPKPLVKRLTVIEDLFESG